MSVSVEKLLQAKEAQLALELVAGVQGVDRLIAGPRVQKPSLALTGYTQHVNPERLQVLGLTEISYLQTLDPEMRKHGIEALCSLRPCAIVVTRGLEAPAELVDCANANKVTVFRTPLQSSAFINRVTKFLEDLLSPTTSMHGVLIDVLGIGIMLM